MSHAASDWAFNLPIIGAWKGVLNALAWHADEDGKCHPGLERLRLFAGLKDDRSVRRCLRELEIAGAISVVCSRGGRRASDYRLNLKWVLPPGAPQSGPETKKLRDNGHDPYGQRNTRTQSPGNSPDLESPLMTIPGPRVPSGPEKDPDPESPLKKIPGPRVLPPRTQSPPNLHRRKKKKETPTTTTRTIAPREAAAAWTGDEKIIWEAWNAMAATAGLAHGIVQTAKRKGQVTARLKEHGLDGVLDAIGRIGRSSFCRGGGPRGWRADFDFLLQPSSLLATRSGRYDDRKPQGSAWDRFLNPFAPASDDDWEGTTIDGEVNGATYTH